MACSICSCSRRLCIQMLRVPIHPAAAWPQQMPQPGGRRFRGRLRGRLRRRLGGWLRRRLRGRFRGRLRPVPGQAPAWASAPGAASSWAAVGSVSGAAYRRRQAASAQGGLPAAKAAQTGHRLILRVPSARAVDVSILYRPIFASQQPVHGTFRISAKDLQLNIRNRSFLPLRRDNAGVLMSIPAV